VFFRSPAHPRSEAKALVHRKSPPVFLPLLRSPFLPLSSCWSSIVRSLLSSADSGGPPSSLPDRVVKVGEPLVPFFLLSLPDGLVSAVILALVLLFWWPLGRQGMVKRLS